VVQRGARENKPKARAQQGRLTWNSRDRMIRKGPACASQRDVAFDSMYVNASITVL
jgi:hypothetical protein